MRYQDAVKEYKSDKLLDLVKGFGDANPSEQSVNDILNWLSETYSEETKCNKDMFYVIPQIDIGAAVIRFIRTDIIDAEAEYYVINSQNEGVKKYIPGAYPRNRDHARELLSEDINKFILNRSLFLTIAFKKTDRQQPIPFGYISCNAPGTYRNFNEWTIDFWLNEKNRGKGIMAIVVDVVLYYLKSKGVSKVCAFTKRDNEAAMRVLQKNHFNYIDDVKEGSNIYEMIWGVKFIL